MSEKPFEFSLPPVLDELNERFVAASFRLYLVGGAVRNLVLGRQPVDWDLCTDAQPDRVMALFRRVIPTGIKHGTVTVIHRGIHFEITTFRIDGAYSDARRPDSVEFTSDIIQDLARRDFTMNAMAISLADKTLVDPFGGKLDIARKLIRTVGDPLSRFDEDGLRIARLFRFASQLGFDIDNSTWAAIPERLFRLSSVSVERFRDEFIKTLLSSNSVRGLSMFASTNAIKDFLPELSERLFIEQGSNLSVSNGIKPSELAILSSLLPANTMCLRFACLCIPAEGYQPVKTNALLVNFKLSNNEREKIVTLVSALSGGIKNADQEAARKFLSAYGQDITEQCIQFFQVLTASPCNALKQQYDASIINVSGFCASVETVLNRKDPITLSDLEINGEILKDSLGLKPSRLTGEILKLLLDQVLKNPEFNTTNQLLDKAREIIKRSSTN